ncbi:DM13 domain-containing protein [Iamia majanohamensis]|uniref:DM13 domain-containing protein n=1 Tax=Iamia majanohamensis TaxID=467976 RepID=A0AAE9Y5I4_9ACTN|nr:DM13 domain-containing protein [Iamia majanohamensis]WCO67145.1 DM13 domain-containing protein [Iamia majanohamensis]
MAGAVVVVAVVAVLAFGVFGVQTLFTDDEVSEAGPTFDSGATAGAEPAADPAGGEPGAPASTAPADAPAVTTVATGAFEDVDHPGEGSATLLTDGNQTFVRFEDDFSTDNGPDLFAVVYVGEERIELGELKGNVGAQNYELPPEVDPASVTTVAVWCKRFDSTFTEAAVA